MKTMRAIVARSPGGPDSLVLEERPVPEPHQGEVRIRVAYSPLNPLDTHARADRIKWSHPGFPFTTGYEYAGRVDAVGPGVDDSLVGTRVAVRGNWGGNADYAVAPETQLVDIPECFSWQLGSVFSTTAPTAWHLVHSAARLRAGQTILLHSAAGSVAILTAQIAASIGARVIGLAGSADKCRYAERYGMERVINYTEADWTEQVLALTDGRGVDVIVDGNAGPQANLNYEICAPLGSVIYIGAIAGHAPDVNISMLISKAISVTGFVVPLHEATTAQAERKEILAKLAAGEWVIPIETIASLEQVPAIHAQFEARKLFGRTLITVGGDI